MARARNIKPAFFKNEDLAECSPWARLCFIGLWTLADRDGRLEDRPKRIRGELFALDDEVVIGPLLDQLAAHGFIRRYVTSSGMPAIQIVKFVEHQTPHYSERDSVIEAPELQEFQESPLHDGGKTPGEHLESGAHDEGVNPENSAGVGGNSAHDPVMKRGSKPPESPITDSLNPDSLSATPAAPSVLVDRCAINGHEPPGYRVPDCPYDELLAVFHKELPALPHIVAFNDARKTSLRARWVEVCAAEKFERQEGVDWFRDFFRMLSHSAFLTGHVTNFKASFDWLTKPKNFAKAVEGNYQGRRQ